MVTLQRVPIGCQYLASTVQQGISSFSSMGRNNVRNQSRSRARLIEAIESLVATWKGAKNYLNHIRANLPLIRYPFQPRFFFAFAREQLDTKQVE